MSSELVRQDDFSGGEVAPLSYGRTKSAAYQHGLRLAKNFIAMLEGPLVNRTGTRYVDGVKDASYSPRLFTFSFSDGQTFLLEVGDHYIRFFQNGAAIRILVATTWSNIATYADHNWASFNGTIYRSLQNGNTNHQPDVSPTWWVADNHYEIAAPWASADLDHLDAAQDGDVITFTCVNGATQYGPFELTRVSNLNWQITSPGFTAQAYFAGTPTISPFDAAVSSAQDWANWPIGLSVAPGTLMVYKPAADPTHFHLYQAKVLTLATPDTASDWTDLSWSSATTYAKGQYVWDAASNNVYMSLIDQNLNNAVTVATAWVVATDSTRPAKDWKWALTILWSDLLGRTFETLPSLVTGVAGVTVAVYSDRPAKITWTAPGNPGFAYEVLGYRVYRGRNGIYGYIGLADAGATSFKDDGSAPDFGVQPPRATNPFDYATGAGTKTQSYPRAVVHHEQRVIYAGSSRKPSAFWGSKTGNAYNFDLNTPVQATDSFEFKPSSEKLADIRHLLSLRQLLLFTGAGVWHCYAPQGAISTANVLLRRCNGLGSSFLRPLAIDMAALYYTARGKVRDLSWDFRTDNYAGHDVSGIARHLLDRRTLTDWAYAESPFSIVWAVRDDGTLLSMTYALGAAEAWAQHITDGVFERVATLIEADPYTGVFEDAVYVLVKRVVNNVTVRYIERFSSRMLPQTTITNANGTKRFVTDVRRSNFLDCSLEYDGRNRVQNVTLVAQLGQPPYAAQSSVNISAPANPIVLPGSTRGFQASDVGSAIVIDADELAGGPFVVTITQVNGALSAVGVLDQALPAQYQNTQLTAALGILIITGLAHLEGKSVTVLADGAVVGPFVVTGGQITLQDPAVLAQIGLGYNSDMELLDISPDAVKTNVKSVKKVTLEVAESRGVYAGASFDDASLKLYEAKQQRVSETPGVPPLRTGNIEVSTASSWEQHGRACVRQKDPLPLTILAVVREVVLGGR